MSDVLNRLGFDALLHEAAPDNASRACDRETAHLPSTWAEALACHYRQIESYRAAMLANHFAAAVVIRKEPHVRARKLNNGKPGILASDGAPGCKLDAEASARPPCRISGFPYAPWITVSHLSVQQITAAFLAAQHHQKRAGPLTFFVRRILGAYVTQVMLARLMQISRDWCR